MLMVKKTTYDERTEWGMKYLEKGFKKIQYSSFKNELKEQCKEQIDIYLKDTSQNQELFFMSILVTLLRTI